MKNRDGSCPTGREVPGSVYTNHILNRIQTYPFNLSTFFMFPLHGLLDLEMFKKVENNTELGKKERA